ncbi:MAG: GldG family protein [Clostridiales bacterium]|nr:GldG family protein [Clostridiales bacterium]
MLDKRFRYGTFSTVMMLLAIVLFVLVNLVAGEFNYTRDLTAEQLFTLSEQSRDFLAELDEDVTLTLIAGAGKEFVIADVSRITRQLLEEYADASPRIRIETRDPMLNPALIHRFAAEAGVEGGIPDFSVVVESGTGVRVIEPQEMIDYEQNWFTGAVNITGYNIEREITRTIHRAVQGADAIIYYVTGSGEASLAPEFITFLENENYVFREVNLVLYEIPDDADILFIPMPQRDWTEIKAQRISDFLQNEGRAFFALDYADALTPNLAGVLDAYGLALSDNLIIEESPQNIFAQYFIIPNVAQHEITENLRAQNFANIMTFFPVEMQINGVRRTTLDIAPLWITSQSAFARSIDTEAESLARIPSDIAGPFPLALAVTDRIFTQGEEFITRLVFVNSTNFISPQLNAYIGEGNWQFVLNSMRWLQDTPTSIYIPGKTPPGQMPLLITDGATRVIGGVAMGGLPLICIAIGAVIWLRRRNA